MARPGFGLLRIPNATQTSLAWWRRPHSAPCLRSRIPRVTQKDVPAGTSWPTPAALPLPDLAQHTLHTSGTYPSIALEPQCLYIYIYMCVYICMHMHTNMHAYIHMYVLCMYTCTCMRGMYVLRYAGSSVCTNRHACTRRHMCF